MFFTNTHICSQILVLQVPMALNSLTWMVCTTILLLWIIWPYHVTWLYHVLALTPCSAMQILVICSVSQCWAMLGDSGFSVGFSSNIDSQYIVVLALDQPWHNLTWVNHCKCITIFPQGSISLTQGWIHPGGLGVSRLFCLCNKLFCGSMAFW